MSEPCGQDEKERRASAQNIAGEMEKVDPVRDREGGISAELDQWLSVVAGIVAGRVSQERQSAYSRSERGAVK